VLSRAVVVAFVSVVPVVVAGVVAEDGGRW
jgi:hypothetical protein